MTPLDLLQQLIATESVSGGEEQTATTLSTYLSMSGVNPVNRRHNNIWAVNAHFDKSKPTLLLCSHHDTVRPSTSYTRNPFAPTIEQGRLYGLGSNDAGASVVAMAATFLRFYEAQNMSHNICLCLVGEEEISGKNGLESVLNDLPPLAVAIVGEPTQMKLAIGERGLLVVDCVANGRSGHAARNEGLNAIYVAMQDIAWAATYQFERLSPLFGSVKLTTTIINAGSAHNVVPDTCHFVVDCRVSEQYTLGEVLDTMRDNMTSTLTPRSMRLNPSSIALEHPLVQIGLQMGIDYYGSPTTSDAALLTNIPTLKMGVGDSARSHTADEYIDIQEVEQGIEIYHKLIEQFMYGAR